MILDEQSLVIETTADKEARATLANTKVIYMDEFSGSKLEKLTFPIKPNLLFLSYR